MGKITHAELVEMFGDEMPLDAVMLITNAPSNMTTDELRAKLHALASQPVPAPDLVERLEAVLGPWRNDETDGATATLLEIDGIVATALRERNG